MWLLFDTAAGGRVVGRAAREEFGLHRLEAGTLVDNKASQRVLTKCGFAEIGLAPGFLHIDGAWRDHVLFQRLCTTGRPRTSPSNPASPGVTAAGRDGHCRGHGSSTHRAPLPPPSSAPP